jgi:hypothetical protein
MRTTSDIQRKTSLLSAVDNEKMLRFFTASYDTGRGTFSSWKLGNLCLTEQRLLFVQVQKVLFQIPLDQIQQMDLVERRWILGKKIVQLYILWDDGRTRNAFIAVKDPQNWKADIEKLVSDETFI